MNIGIDGNMWYESNGLCLGDPKAQFAFERTLRETITAHQKEFGGGLTCIPDSLAWALDLTPEEAKDRILSEVWGPVAKACVVGRME